MSTPEQPPGERPGQVVQLVHLTREPAGEPEGALILLHGRAVDERDLYPMLDELDPDRRFFGMTPGAPLTNVPPGGRHWYVIREIGHPEEDTFIDTLEKLCRFLDDELRHRGIPWLDPRAKRGMPAYVTHGSYDPIIPVGFGRKARDLLEEGGLYVTFREARVQHSIDFALIPEMRDWVASVISGQPVIEGPRSEI